MTRKTGVIGVIVGVGLMGATILQARAKAGGQPAPSVARPAVAQGSRTVAAEGRVLAYPGAEVRVSAERAGRLVRLPVQEGQAVRAGALLAEIESEELRAALDEARAGVAEAEAEVRLAEADRARRQRLVEERILAIRDLDQANRDLDIARARLETARATVERYSAQLRKCRVVAPIAGTVTVRHLDAGETVNPGDPVVTLADLGRLRVEAEADEADVALLAVGAPAVITADAYPGRSWKGRVEEVADSVTLRKLKPQDPSRPTDTRILAVKVAFAEAAPLRLGTTVELRIEPRVSAER